MKRFFNLRNETGPLRVDGEAVKRARCAAGMTQAEVAARMDLPGYALPQPYVSNLEHGKYRWGFSERMASALASALGVGVSEIAGGRLLAVWDAQRIRELVDQLGALVEPHTELDPRGRAA